MKPALGCKVLSVISLWHPLPWSQHVDVGVTLGQRRVLHKLYVHWANTYNVKQGQVCLKNYNLGQKTVKTMKSATGYKVLTGNSCGALVHHLIMWMWVSSYYTWPMSFSRNATMEDSPKRNWSMEISLKVFFYIGRLPKYFIQAEYPFNWLVAPLIERPIPQV